MAPRDPLERKFDELERNTYVYSMFISDIFNIFENIHNYENVFSWKENV